MSSSSGDPQKGARGAPSGASEEPAERELDLSGEVCPYTFVRARLALEEMPLDAKLWVFVDHEPATRNIPRSAEAWGQRVEAVAPRTGGWVVAIRKRVD